MAHTAHQTASRRAARLSGRHAAWLLLLAAPCVEPRSNRPVPVCAVQDCKSGEILDDGCAADGKCKSCINDCGGLMAPRTDHHP